jgi:hypothetical protein
MRMAMLHLFTSEPWSTSWPIPVLSVTISRSDVLLPNSLHSSEPLFAKNVTDRGAISSCNVQPLVHHLLSLNLESREI